MPTSKVSIQFTSLNDLRKFIRVIDTNVYEMNLKKFTITCHCSEEHISLAVEKYNGKVINAMQEKV